ncbi:MAG: exodeoxyribonuclease V subunit alpha, partial [Lautropia sp.]
ELPANTAALLRTLKTWSAQGWLRRLDSAFAGFMLDLCPDAPPPVVMAAALVAHMEGRGHSCLLIDGLFSDPDALLGWGPEATAEFHTVSTVFAFRREDWLLALRVSPLVRVDHWPSQSSQPDANQPLVLRGDKLYLRRYWCYERQVAARVLQRATAPIAVDEKQARSWLDRLFPPLTDSTQHAQMQGKSPSILQVDWQKVACAMALRSGLSVITGGPGTGKTYTASRLLALLLALDPHPERLRVAVAAPTGKAAARLKQSIGGALEELQAMVAKDLPLDSLVRGIGPARTLHSLLGARPDTRKFRYDAANPLEVDVLIVDEASMIHLEMMAALLEALPARGRLILLGDKDQLASVEAGAVLGELCRDAELGRYRPETAAFIESVSGEQLPVEFRSEGPPLAQQTVMLRTSRRFGDRIGQVALAANAGDADRATALLGTGGDDSSEDSSEDSSGKSSDGTKSSGGELLWLDAKSADVVVKLAVQGRPGAVGGYGGSGGYLEMLRQRPPFKSDLFDAQSFDSWVTSVLRAFERFRLLCAVHEGEWGTQQLNAAIERALTAKGLINRRRGEWYEGRPVMVTRNDAGIGVFNGDIGIALRPMNAAATEAPARVYFLDGASIRSVGVSRLAHVETAFALTVHKSQGSEFDHTVLVLPQAPSRVLTRELVYTGITRARGAFTLATGRRQAFVDALGQRTRRSSGLLELLDPGEKRTTSWTPVT